VPFVAEHSSANHASATRLARRSVHTSPNGYFCPTSRKGKSSPKRLCWPVSSPAARPASRRQQRAGSLLSAHGLNTSVTLALRPPLTAHIPLPESTCGYQAPAAACCTEDLRDQGYDPLRAGTLTFSRGWAQITKTQQNGGEFRSKTRRSTLEGLKVAEIGQPRSPLSGDYPWNIVETPGSGPRGAPRPCRVKIGRSRNVSGGYSQTRPSPKDTGLRLASRATTAL